MRWGSGLACSSCQQLGEPVPLPKPPAAMAGGLRRDPSVKPGSFGSSQERGLLPLPSLISPINPGPSLPPVGSH